MQNREMYPPEHPCEIEYTNMFQCIQRFRDIMNIGTLLYEDIETELSNHRIKLVEAGWSEDHIKDFQNWAASSTIWEEQIPRRIRTLGNQRTFQDIKARSK